MWWIFKRNSLIYCRKRGHLEHARARSPYLDDGEITVQYSSYYYIQLYGQLNSFGQLIRTGARLGHRVQAKLQSSTKLECIFKMVIYLLLLLLSLLL